MNIIKKLFNKYDDKRYRKSKYNDIINHYIHELYPILKSTHTDEQIMNYVIRLTEEYVNKGTFNPLDRHSVIVAPYAITDKIISVRVASYRCLKCRTLYSDTIDLQAIWKKRVPPNAHVINKQCKTNNCNEWISIELHEIHKFLN